MFVGSFLFFFVEILTKTPVLEFSSLIEIFYNTP